MQAGCKIWKEKNKFEYNDFVFKNSKTNKNENILTNLRRVSIPMVCSL